jgi:hypothetical protein
MRSIGRRAVVLFSGSVLAATAVTASASPASAGSSESVSTSRGAVVWTHSGDKISVADTLKDGRSIEGNYRRDSLSAPIHVLHVAGKGKSDSRTWNLPEGTNIEIRMCYREGSVVTKCSGWQNAEA